MELVRQETFSLEPRNLQEAMHLARIMAESDMVPKDYRNKPSNVLVSVQMGRELGLSPMQALQNIAVINGRPSVWGDAMLALCQAHPSCIDVIETFDDATMTATCTVRRLGKGSVEREPITRAFNVDDAKKAQLWGKQGPWQQYPKRMLQLRARAFALRDAFSDVLRGLGMAEENADIPQEPMKNVTPKTVQRSPSAPALQPKASVTVIDASTLEPAAAEQDAQPGPEPEKPADAVEEVFALYRTRLAEAADEAELRRIAKEEWTWAEKDKARAVEIYKEALKALRHQQQRAQLQQAPWDELEQQSHAQAKAAVSRDPGAEG